MAERSEAFVLRNTGGRQNVVQLRTLKRTRLASREHVWLKCRQLGYTNIQNAKKKHFSLSNSTIASNEFPVDNFDCAHVPPAMLSTLYRKNKIELKFQEKKSEEKQSKAKKRKKEGKKKGVQGGVPLCAADTNFPKERKSKRTCNERKNNKEEKAGIKRMPTHNLANSRTPDHK